MTMAIEDETLGEARERLSYGGRQSGRTTALAMLTIGYSMTHPGLRVPIVTHAPDTHPARKHFEGVIIDILTRLNLVGLRIVDTTDGGKALVFNLSEMQTRLRSI